MLSYLTGWTLMNTQMWYIVEVLFQYLLFYLVFKPIKKKGAACLVYGIVLCAMVGKINRLRHMMQHNTDSAKTKQPL